MAPKPIVNNDYAIISTELNGSSCLVHLFRILYCLVLSLGEIILVFSGVTVITTVI